MESIRLTSFSKGSGCGCKIAPAVLQEILQSSNKPVFTDKLLVGYQSNDDAAVYLLNEEKAIISTTDFFTPIVDDPFVFGQIAAANAISDVYAMGGSPIMALAILGWPVDKIPPAIAQQVIEGGRDICLQAGIPLAGGHSIDVPEPIFGLAVTGEIHPTHIKKNNTAKRNDLLLLTKPIGIGVLAAAQKRGILEESDLQILVKQLTQLNKVGEALGKLEGVHAVTDITGFGLIGHLMEMAEGSDLGAVINYSQIPIITAAKKFIAQRVVPDATYRNWNAYSKEVQFEKGVDVMEAFSLLPDPQTNGGLLIAVSEDAFTDCTEVLNEFGLAAFTKPIGRLTQHEGKRIKIDL
ncbi:MAG: selenide, water dikinase SelD [Chitinophagaceae bacterium]|nr:selenide, water dikinase SelD [Chitinophagaceae bacterium]